MDSEIANSMLTYALERVFLECKSVLTHAKITKTGFPCYLITRVQLGVSKIKGQRMGPSPGAEDMELPAWHQLWQRSRASARSLRRKLPPPRALEQPSDSRACWILSCRRHLQGDEIKKKWHI